MRLRKFNLMEICSPKQWKTIATKDLLESGYAVYGANGKIGFYKEYTHEKSTLMITCRGATCGTLNISEPYSYINGNAMALDNLKESIVDIKFLYYFLKARGLQDTISGSAQPQITRTALEQVSVYLPDLTTQERTVEIIDKAQEIIDKRKEQIQACDELIKSQFIEMFGDPIKNPKDWLVEEMQGVCEDIVDCPHSTPKYTNEDTGYMCIRTSIIKPNRLLWDNIEYISEDEYLKRVKRREPQQGDIVYSREGAILGIAALIDRECKVALGQRSMLLSVNRSICNPCFLSNLMNSESFTRKVKENIGGSASPHINVKDIKQFKVITPPIELQNQFVQFVQQVDKLKVEMQQSLVELENNFNSLMQRAFKGELF